jgi:hypothetical protein
MIGARPNGEKDLLAVEDGYRESAESWKTVLRELKRRGMVASVLAVGDGALGFWPPPARSGPRPESRVAGVTIFPMCSISCRSAYIPVPSAHCTR